MPKYRQSKVKRQHHVLKNLEEGLRFLSSLDTVSGIIPGTIKPKSGGSIGFSFQYFTPSGLKLIGRSSGAAQEIFVITQSPEHVLERLREAQFIASDPTPPPEQSPSKP